MGVFGRKGEGPGEFGAPASLARGEEGTVGVMDLELGRFTVFEPSGVYVSDVVSPSALFSPLSPFGDILSGASMDIMALMSGESSGSTMNRFDVNIASGEVVRGGGVAARAVGRRMRGSLLRHAGPGGGMGLRGLRGSSGLRRRHRRHRRRHGAPRADLRPRTPGTSGKWHSARRSSWPSTGDWASPRP